MPTTTPRRAPRAATAPPSPRRRYCDVTAAADYLGVNPRTVRRLLTEGRLTAYRVGDKLIRLDWSEVESLAVRVEPSDVSS